MNPHERKHEDQVVRYLLKQYGLHDTRTKFMLLDLEEGYFDSNTLPCVAEGHSPPRLLSLRAFHRFFPEFPVSLETYWLSKQEANRTNLAKGLAELDHTLFVRHYNHLCGEQPGADDARPFGRIYHQLYQRTIATSLVMHNIPTIDSRVPGLHLCFRFETGESMMIQTLNGFVATLKLAFPEARWLDSAMDGNFRALVSSSSVE